MATNGDGGARRAAARVAGDNARRDRVPFGLLFFFHPHLSSVSLFSSPYSSPSLCLFLVYFVALLPDFFFWRASSAAILAVRILLSGWEGEPPFPPGRSKETAFIYAVTSAGVVHAVTQACSSGNLTDCSCDMSKQGLDNLRFGIQFARQFVDAPEKERHKKFKRVRNLMNLHNNEAGREAISRLMKMQCRCHGVSGSCELKTCWRSIPTFSAVGDYLKDKYNGARQYKRKKRSRSSRRRDRSRGRRKRRSRRNRRFPVGKDELVHIHKSPNYCVKDPKKGILGTYGRYCNKTSRGADSCDLLCCGRGYNTQVVRYVERCHCKFVWCCYVKCKTCVTNVDVHTCK
ncbi:putative secreted signaling factor WNT16 [Penaeus vannamei]|uniref:Protein Wnt n=1 Tax=Penaeus vannamei TaxID=6689 RepID=A0A423U5Q4_PENVA|nr:putative secreted signaling factor WNT16 [Penaeus vannamei]